MGRCSALQPLRRRHGKPQMPAAAQGQPGPDSATPACLRHDGDVERRWDGDANDAGMLGVDGWDVTACMAGDKQVRLVQVEDRQVSLVQANRCQKPPKLPSGGCSQGGGVEADVEQAVIPLRHAARAAAARCIVAEGWVHRHGQLAVRQGAEQDLQGRVR